MWITFIFDTQEAVGTGIRRKYGFVDNSEFIHILIQNEC